MQSTTGDHLSALTSYAHIRPLVRTPFLPFKRTLPTMAIRPRLIAWAEPQHENMLRSLIADNACELIGVCSARANDAAALAQSLDTEPLSDLRQAVLSPDTEVVWLASPATLDPALRSAIREHGILILTSEPMPALLAQPPSHDADLAAFVPSFVDGAGFSSAMDALEQFGACQAMNLIFTGRPEHGSLFARLFDAMVTVRKLLGHAELVDATMLMPRANVPEQLAALDGTMTLNLRVEGHRSASVLVSNTANTWQREVFVIGEQGRSLRITEETAHWTGEVDTPGSATSFADIPTNPGTLIADRLMRFMQLPTEARSHGDGPQLLAMCEAARLSAKVGFAEAPGTISQMLGRP